MQTMQSMDQRDYNWIWARRRWINNFPNSSWEEQAFAEDTAGPLGGCIWPPRSYSCSFCRREFRSAQALGGHMNVHRRDRARLRQLPPSPSSEDKQNCTRQEIGSNPSFDDHLLSKFSPLNFHSSSNSSTLKENQSECLGARKEVVELNLGFASLKRKPCSSDDYDEAIISRKRRCVDPVIFPLLMKSDSQSDRNQLQNEVIKLSPSLPVEELDLELRLGNCPKVKVGFYKD